MMPSSAHCPPHGMPTPSETDHGILARHRSGPRFRVLVVEDHPINQRLARRQLESLGHDVAIAPDGVAALDAWQHLPFDAILMDCRMPGLDGYEATRRIRRLEAEAAAEGAAVPPVPIIAFTAEARPNDRERCLAAGMNDYLCKPVPLDVLDATLARHVLA